VRTLRNLVERLNLTTSDRTIPAYRQYCENLVDLERQKVWIWFNQNFTLNLNQGRLYRQLYRQYRQQFRIAAQRDNVRINTPAFTRIYNAESALVNADLQLLFRQTIISVQQTVRNNMALNAGVLAQIANLVTAVQQQAAAIAAIVPPAPAAIPPREVNLIKIEPFDGTGDPIFWIEHFEKAATANGLTDARKLAVVPAYLTGTAATWLQERQANVATNPAAWTHAPGANAAAIAVTFKQPFIDHFRTPGRIAIWQQALENHKQQPGETVDQYVSKMQTLMKKIDPVNAATEYTKVANFMRGLDARIKFHVRAANPVTLAEAVNLARGFEMSYNELNTSIGGILPAANNQVTALLGELQSQVEALRLEQAPPQSWKTQYIPRKPDARNSQLSQKQNTCNFCQKIGHNARECRSRLATITCHACGQKGHEQRNCRNTRGFSQTRQVRWQSQDARNYNQNWRRNDRNNQRQFNLNEEEVAEIVQSTLKNLKD
jgi:hypothetical protein